MAGDTKEKVETTEKDYGTESSWLAAIRISRDPRCNVQCAGSAFHLRGRHEHWVWNPLHSFMHQQTPPLYFFLRLSH